MSEPPHVARVLRGPLRGIHSTYTLSGQHFGRHWHDAYGFGILEKGAQRSASGRGRVDAFAGQVITTNPGEVHDGRPLGGPTRRWRILSVDTDALSCLVEQGSTPPEITRPVIDDPALFQALRRLFRTIELWNARAGNQATEALACEEALVESAAATNSCAVSRRRISCRPTPGFFPAVPSTRCASFVADNRSPRRPWRAVSRIRAT